MREATATTGLVAPAIDVVVESALWTGEPYPQDAQGALLGGLNTGTFHVSENGSPASILRVDAQGAYLDVCMALDASRSMQNEDKIILAREAAAESKPLTHHLAHLAVHGYLHLLGYDHESDDDAETMERLERTILARLGLPDPYLARDTGA